MVTEFFMPMIPPTVTAQEHQVRVVNNKPIFFEPPKLKTAKDKLTANLLKHKPTVPYTSAVRLIVKWCFPRGRHSDGEYRTTKPDTDNLNKLLKHKIFLPVKKVANKGAIFLLFMVAFPH